MMKRKKDITKQRTIKLAKSTEQKYTAGVLKAGKPNVS